MFVIAFEHIFCNVRFVDFYILVLKAEIEEFSRRTEEERIEFERHLAADREHIQMQRLDAATLIQAAFRSYR